MQILTHNNVVMYYGTIEKGIYPADPRRELYKIVNKDGTFYSVTNGLTLHNVSDIPEDYENFKYCYTKTNGFYKNPDYREPEPTVEEKLERIWANMDYLAMMANVEL